jgi:hypothetical protein
VYFARLEISLALLKYTWL